MTPICWGGWKKVGARGAGCIRLVVRYLKYL
jgi:hypothetical protein